MEEAVSNDLKKEHQEKINRVAAEVSKIVVGQEYMVNRLLIGLFTNGHILLEGVPGIAKTLTVNTLAQVLHLDFQRIQFTPDLLPADLVGTMIYNQKKAEFEVKKGPIFGNVILADEVNRAPAKVQSALLEAMQEKTVTIGETSYKLDRPFIVLATQNPIDQEGTYSLPEAQIDRFMFKLIVTYPTMEEEREIMRRMSAANPVLDVKPVITLDQIVAMRQQLDDIRFDDRIDDYILRLVDATRNPANCGLDIGGELG